MKFLKFLLFIFLLYSCEKDLISFESGVINSENAINFSSNQLEFSVKNNSENLDPVQSNGLPSYLLGSYNHPQFGTINSSFVGQLVPADYNHNFGENAVIDSVIMRIPIYSRGVETSEDGDITYEIDSVYGEAPIKISVYRNNFFLRTFDPYSEFGMSQKYFTDGSLSSSEFLSPSQLEGDLLFEINDFVPSAEQINLTEIDTSTNEPYVSQKLSPSIRFKLNNPGDNFWETNFVENDENQVLSSENKFKDFFRGIYIKTEQNNPDGSMMLLNLASSNSRITIHYSSDSSVIVDDNVDLIETNQHEYVLNFSGNLVNIIENEQLFNFSENDEGVGDENIYLSGGQGVITKLDLFSGLMENENGDEVDEFEYFKNFFVDEETNQPKRIINEAFIEFFVNSTYSNEDEPDRIYIYNYENNTPLIDYYLDQSISSTTINAKINHLEPLKRDSTSNSEGISYKIRITEHLNNIILRDSSNAKLGLAVISDIAAIQNQLIQNENGPKKSIVSGSLLSPKGTILHGNLSNSVDKRPKIKIYYTEPKSE
jgi:hypothetical protein